VATSGRSPLIQPNDKAARPCHPRRGREEGEGLDFGSHTATISLIGNYTVSVFTVSSDGHGGTKVVDPTAPSAAPLTQAIASFQAGPAPNYAGTAPYQAPKLPLVHAHV
jgi:hypothetical protein